MPPRTIESEGRTWSVSVSGRRTQYTQDEFGIVFTSQDEVGERRIMRYSPRGPKSQERALHALTDVKLVDLLRRSQPSWTSPELGYQR